MRSATLVGVVLVGRTAVKTRRCHCDVGAGTKPHARTHQVDWESENQRAAERNTISADGEQRRLATLGERISGDTERFKLRIHLPYLLETCFVLQQLYLE